MSQDTWFITNKYISDLGKVCSKGLDFLQGAQESGVMMDCFCQEELPMVLHDHINNSRRSHIELPDTHCSRALHMFILINFNPFNGL